MTEIPDDIREAVCAVYNQHDGSIAILCARLAAALLAERKRTIEACAEIAKEHRVEAEYPDFNGGYDAAAEDIEAAIRAQLK